jgi:predicted glutamine amidotransferase
MCRILYALNQPNCKSKIRNFFMQSTLSPMAKDGHGLAGLNPKTKKWRVYKSPEPADTISDPTTIANIFAEYPLVIGHIRNAHIIDVPKSVIANELNSKPENTHPFYYKNHVFLHNGRFINAHHPSVRRWFQSNILPEYWQHVKGNTDSEMVFYLFLSIMQKHNQLNKDIHMLKGTLDCKVATRFEELRDMVKECFKLLDARFSLYIANFVYSDKDYSIVGRLEKNAAPTDRRIKV